MEESENLIHLMLFVFHFSISLKNGFGFSFSYGIWKMSLKFVIRLSFSAKGIETDTEAGISSTPSQNWHFFTDFLVITRPFNTS